MRPLATWAAVLGLTVGLSSAGPVAWNSTGSQCNIQCSGSGKLMKFTPGHVYTYEYSTETKTALEQSNGEKSTLYLDADVSLHAVDSCRLALKIDSVRLEEEITGDSRKPSKGSQQLADMLMKNPLEFNYQDGVVSRLCPTVLESPFALNIKRGILSMIQNSLSSLESTDETVDELDVAGVCRTHYSVSKGWPGPVSVLKKKSSSKCHGEGEQHALARFSPVGQIVRSAPLINMTQECQQDIKDGIIGSIECRERHVVRAFTRQEKSATAVTVVSQRLHLRRAATSGVQPRLFDTPKRSADVTTLKFDRSAEDAAINTNLEQRATELINRLAADLEKVGVETAPAMFSELVQVLRKMDYAILKKLIAAHNTNVAVDALTHTMTREAVQLTGELVKEGKISTSSAKLWLMRLAVASDVDVKVIAHLIPLFDNVSLITESRLAASAVARTAFVEGQGRVYREIESLLARLSSDLNKTNEDEVIAALKAIGNLGEIAGAHNDLVIQAAQHTRFSPMTRLAAVEATRHVACNETKTSKLMEIFADHSDDLEVRIGAYLAAVRCPTAKLIAKVSDVLHRESTDSQLAPFVYSHIKELDKRSWFQHDLSAIINDEQLKRLDSEDKLKTLSKSRIYEMFLDPIDMGFEVEADSIASDKFKAFRLNATFDVFGRHVNVFESRVRLQNDLSTVDGLVRLFGSEVLYKHFDRRSKSAELDALLKRVLSPEGLHISRSMMILDAEYVRPTGTGLPLTIAVNATASLSATLKAAPEGQQAQQKNKEHLMVARAYASPNAAMELGVTMAVRAPLTVSGLRMKAIASTQWTLDGSLEMDVRSPGLLRVDISAPRDRSDIIDIKSNVYLVGGERQRELVSNDARPKQWNYCTGEQSHVLFGHKVCIEAAFPTASNDEAAFFLLRGKTHMNVRVIKTDKSLTKFELESSSSHERGVKDQVLLRLDTPGSQVDRQFVARLYNDLRNSKFGLELLSPVKKFAAEGTYQNSPTAKTVQIAVKIDGTTKVTINGDLGIAKGRSNIYSPVIEVLTEGKKQVLLVKSELAMLGNHKISGDIEIKTPYNTERPFRLNGDYMLDGADKKRITLGIDSAALEAHVDSTLSLAQGDWAASAEGHYTVRQGAKHQFLVNGKLAKNEGRGLTLETNVHRNGVSVIAVNGRYTLENPLSADATVILHGKRYGAKISHEEQPNKEKTLSAVAEFDDQRYGATLRYALEAQKAKVDLKLDLADGKPKNAKMSYTRVGDAVKITGWLDAYRQPYSVVVTYAPQNGMHRLTGNLNIGEDSFQAKGVFSVEGSYQAKMDVLHNNAKVLLSSIAIGKDLKRPSAKINVIYRGKPIIDASTEALLESNAASLLFAMRAPAKINGNLALKATGSLRDNLKLDATVAIKSPENDFDFTLRSAADLVIYGRSKRANLEASTKLPRGNFKLTLKNTLDENAWNVEWLFKAPEDERDSKLTTAGVFSFDPKTKMHLRGSFEVDGKLYGRSVRVEPASLNTELRFADLADVEFKTDLSLNAQPVISITVNGAHTEQKKAVTAAVRVYDKSYSTEWTLLGRDLRNGYKLTMATTFDDKKILANGDLQLSPDTAIVKAEVETPFETLRQAKFVVQQQQRSAAEGTMLVFVELAYGDHFVKGDLSLSPKHFEAKLRSSLKDWENLKATGVYQDAERRLRLTFSHPLYEENSLEIVLDPKTDNRHTIRGRVSIPKLFRGGDLAEFEGNFKPNADTISGAVRFDVIYRGQQAMKVYAELRNENNLKRLSAIITHTLTRYSQEQLIKIEGELKTTEWHSHEAKLTVLKDAEQLFDGSFLTSLRKSDTETGKQGIFGELQLNGKSSLLREWDSVWFMNKLAFTAGESVQFRHEFGRSPRHLVSGLGITGKYQNSGKQLVVETSVGGQWKELQASVAGEINTDKKDTLQATMKVDSHHGHLVLAEMKLDRKQRMISGEGKLELPRIGKQYGVKTFAGFVKDDEAFEAELKIDRDNKPKKSTVMSLRVPLRGEVLDGHLKVELPEELGGYLGKVELMKKPRVVDVNVAVKLYDDLTTGRFTAAMHKDFVVTSSLNFREKQIAKFDLKAAKINAEKYEGSADLQWREQTLGGKLDVELAPRKVDIAASLVSNSFAQTQTLKASYSVDTKKAELKVDTSKLKVDIDATLVAKNYKLDATAEYEGKQVGELRWSTNEADKSHSIKAKFDTHSGMRELSIELEPTNINKGKAAFEYSADDRKVLVAGTEWDLITESTKAVKAHWTFKDHDWRIELTTKPGQDNGEVTGILFYKEKQVGRVVSLWNFGVNQLAMKFNALLDYSGEKHELKLDFNHHDRAIDATVYLHCPWVTQLEDKPLEVKLTSRFSPREVSLVTSLTERGILHSLDAKVKIDGEHVTGSVDVHCPTHGSFKGQLEGTFTKNELHFKVTSDKLRRPIEFTGKIAPAGGQLTYNLITADGTQSTGEIYYGSAHEFGFTLHSKQYNVVAVFKAHETFTVTVEAPGLKKTGFKATKSAQGQYTVEVDFEGRTFVVGTFTFNHPAWKAGHFKMAVDFGDSFGKHEITGEYDAVRTRSARLSIDGLTVIEFTLSRESVSLKIAHKTSAQTPATELYFKHGERDAAFAQTFTVSRDGRKLGYELHFDAKRSLAVVELPERRIRLDLQRLPKQAGHDEILGELAWDHSRDANKKIQLKVIRSEQGDNRVVVDASLALLPMGKKLDIHANLLRPAANTWKIDAEAKYNNKPMLSASGVFTETRDGHRVSLSGKHPVTGKEWTVQALKSQDKIDLALKYDDKRWYARYIQDEDTVTVYLKNPESQIESGLVSFDRKAGRLSAIIDEFQLVGQLSAKESKLLAAYQKTEFVKIGYVKHGKRLSAFALWKPQLGSDLQMAAKNLQRKLEGQSFIDRLLTKLDMPETVKIEWRQLADYFTAEARAIVRDFRAAFQRLIDAYEREERVKMLVEPVVRAVRDAADYVTRVSNELNDSAVRFYQRSKRSMARYGERAGVVNTIIAAFANEVYEDLADIVDEYLERVKLTPAKNAVRRVVERSLELVKRADVDYTDALRRLAEENICELVQDGRTQLTNKRCGLAVNTNAHKENVGFAVAMPVMAY